MHLKLFSAIFLLDRTHPLTALGFLWVSKEKKYVFFYIFVLNFKKATVIVTILSITWTFLRKRCSWCFRPNWSRCHYDWPRQWCWYQIGPSIRRLGHGPLGQVLAPVSSWRFHLPWGPRCRSLWPSGSPCSPWSPALPICPSSGWKYNSRPFITYKLPYLALDRPQAKASAIFWEIKWIEHEVKKVMLLIFRSSQFNVNTKKIQNF